MKSFFEKISVTAAIAVVGVIVGFVFVLFVNPLVTTEREYNYEDIKLKNVLSFEEKAKKMYFLKEKENCIFEFTNEKKDNIRIDFSKDILFLSECKENSYCVKTISNDNYRIIYGKGRYFNRETILNYIASCTEYHR